REAAARDRGLRGHDSPSRGVGQRAGPRADAAAGGLAGGGRLTVRSSCSPTQGPPARVFFWSAVAAALAACAAQQPDVAPRPASDTVAVAPPAPRTVRDTALEQRAARLEVRLLERDAQPEGLLALLVEARLQVMRAVGKSRLGGEGRAPLRAGEVPFAVPVRLQANTHGNVRDGPGGAYKVLFTVEPGTALTGYSYVDQWVRVADESGRGGWMFLSLI